MRSTTVCANRVTLRAASVARSRSRRVAARVAHWSSRVTPSSASDVSAEPLASARSATTRVSACHVSTSSSPGRQVSAPRLSRTMLPMPHYRTYVRMVEIVARRVDRSKPGWSVPLRETPSGSAAPRQLWCRAATPAMPSAAGLWLSQRPLSRTVGHGMARPAADPIAPRKRHASSHGQAHRRFTKCARSPARREHRRSASPRHSSCGPSRRRAPASGPSPRVIEQGTSCPASPRRP